MVFTRNITPLIMQFSDNCIYSFFEFVYNIYRKSDRTLSIKNRKLRKNNVELW